MITGQRSGFDHAFAHEVQFVFPNGFGHDSIALRADKLQSVKRTLNNTGSALNTKVGAGHIGGLGMMIHGVAIAGTNLFTETGALTPFFIQFNL